VQFIKKIISVLVLGFVLLPSMSFSDDAAKQSLLTTVAEMKTFSADFKQEMSADGRVVSTPESGFMQVMSPGLFYWSTDDQVIYVRDDKVIIYDKELAQVTIRPLDASLDQLPLMLLFGKADDALEGFEVTQQGEYYSLAPISDNAMIEEIIIGFNEGALANLQIIGAIGQETAVSFSNQKTNTPLGEALFQEKIPPGVDVVTVGS
jgi:outer membrane lipoprotein carrier protein